MPTHLPQSNGLAKIIKSETKTILSSKMSELEMLESTDVKPRITCSHPWILTEQELLLPLLHYTSNVSRWKNFSYMSTYQTCCHEFGDLPLIGFNSVSNCSLNCNLTVYDSNESSHLSHWMKHSWNMHILKITCKWKH